MAKDAHFKGCSARNMAAQHLHAHDRIDVDALPGRFVATWLARRRIRRTWLFRTTTAREWARP